MPYTLAWRLRLFCLLAWTLLAIDHPLGADESSRPDARSLEPRLIHLRNGTAREWSEFPAEPPGETWETRFVAVKNAREATLRWRQQDVKQTWRVLLNGKLLTQLVADEQDLAIGKSVPAGALLTGENLLRIEPAARGATAPDDIRVGQWELVDRPLHDHLHEATLELRVVDEETHAPLPARITIVGASGAMPSIGASSNERLAVRPGVVYLATEPAKIGLPSGRYTIHAGRGFEYSLAKVEVELKAGEALSRTLALRREVPTPGYLACDTHIHTLTHSGHGDATLDERMLTLAGEGIELPIATDHNIAIDFEAAAQRMKVRPYFTPVVGEEFTTSLGHFNLFPLSKLTPLPDPQRADWPALFDEIFRTPGVKVAILNHARDLHRGTRPFGPLLYNAVVAEQLGGWPLRFNAMEVVNSGATQTDPRQLIHDWLGLLNRGQRVTPIGSSDSHDVARYIVGQGRTYIRGDDRDVGNIDVEAAVNSLLQGRVLVSYGLLTELTIDQKYGAGEFAAPVGDEVSVKVRVLGPHWTSASRIELYANGALLREEEIPQATPRDLPRGIKWETTWKLPRPPHDMHLIALAIGPGVASPHWQTAKPYQPTSPEWTPYTLGCSGAVWLDGDRDGRRSSARDYAERLFAATAGNLAKLTTALGDYDAATAAHAAQLYRAAGGSLLSEEFVAAQKHAAPRIQAGFRAYLEAWRENEQARATR